MKKATKATKIDGAYSRPSLEQRVSWAHRGWRFAADIMGEQHSYTRQLWAEYMALASQLEP